MPAVVAVVAEHVAGFMHLPVAVAEAFAQREMLHQYTVY
jgi:hypothetical protein